MRREAAIARLRLAGPRATGRLVLLLQSGSSAARAAALKALDGIADRRAIDPAVAALRDDDADVVIAAAGVLRGWVTHEDGTRVLEALSALALDRDRPPAMRLAALDALSDLPRSIVQPLLEQAPMAASPAGQPQGDDPDAVRAWVDTYGAAAALSELHAVVVQARERERTVPADRRHDWLLVRGAAHAVLARRASRVALYDLREAFDAAQAPLPLDFLNAMTLLGDSSCLEPLARAWAAAPGETWWRDRLADAAGDIVRRHRLSARNAILKRIHAKWPGFL